MASYDLQGPQLISVLLRKIEIHYTHRRDVCKKFVQGRSFKRLIAVFANSPLFSQTINYPKVPAPNSFDTSIKTSKNSNHEQIDRRRRILSYTIRNGL